MSKRTTRTASEMLNPRHEVWRRYGLQRTRGTFEALVTGLTTTPEIADYQGLNHRTVNDHLTALTLYGLAEEQPDCKSWIASIPTLE